MPGIMAPPSSLPNFTPVVPTEVIWRMSVDVYHEMIRSGILTEDDPVELLEGWLVEKMPKHAPHTLATQLTRTALERLVPPGWFVNAQEPVTTPDSEPEPDGLVVRGDRRQYANRHPLPQDVALVIEVSAATLKRDRTLKQRIYARAALPVYWIVNLIDGCIEVYTDPTGPAEQPTYRQRRDYGPADEIPVVLDGREVGRIAVRDILPQ
jgi:Uma2 family endonuclease